MNKPHPMTVLALILLLPMAMRLFGYKDHREQVEEAQTRAHCA